MTNSQSSLWRIKHSSFHCFHTVPICKRDSARNVGYSSKLLNLNFVVITVVHPHSKPTVYLYSSTTMTSYSSNTQSLTFKLQMPHPLTGNITFTAYQLPKPSWSILLIATALETEPFWFQHSKELRHMINSAQVVKSYSHSCTGERASE